MSLVRTLKTRLLPPKKVQTMRSRTDGKYPRLGYDEEELAVAAVRIVDDNTMTSYQRLVTLWNQIRYLDRAGIPGCLVECGSWKGGSSGMMALAHKASGPVSRHLHVFDSFQGLPEPDADHDGVVSIDYASGKAAGRMETIGKCVGTRAENETLILNTIAYPKELARFHEGWFQDTVPVEAPTLGPIALLRLDGDWYESTKVCLDHLFKLVSPKGIVVIDDYGHWEGCRKATDEFLAKLPYKPMLHFIDGTGRYLQTP